MRILQGLSVFQAGLKYAHGIAEFAVFLRGLIYPTGLNLKHTVRALSLRIQKMAQRQY